MDDIEFEDYVKMVRKEKSGRHLHSRAEKQLALYLSYICPDACAVSEVAGVLGGRNDLMLYFFDGRFVAFEFFFSPSQVPQDLRLLEQSGAASKVAILLDSKVNPKLAFQYFRKNPHPFPFLWLRDLLQSSRKELCLDKLSEQLRFVNKFVIPDLPFIVPDPSLFVILPNQSLIAGDKVPGDFELPLIGAASKYELQDRIIRELPSKIMYKMQGRLPNVTPLSISFCLDNPTSSKIVGNFTVQY